LRVKAHFGAPQTFFERFKLLMVFAAKFH